MALRLFRREFAPVLLCRSCAPGIDHDRRAATRRLGQRSNIGWNYRRTCTCATVSSSSATYGARTASTHSPYLP